MTVENLDFDMETQGSYGDSWESFDEDGYWKKLSDIEVEKGEARKESDAKRRGLMDKLFGRKSVNTLSDNEVWKNIEWYLQEFKNNPNFIESKEASQMGLLDKIKNSKDRLEEPLIYKAAAFLLASLEIWGSPYRVLTGYENRWQWLKILLGKAHYEQFLMDKKKCIDDIQNASSMEKNQLQDVLATCEMEYIVNNIRWSNWKLKYFWYHPSIWIGRLSNEFADRLASLSRWQLNKFSVEEKKITHTNEKVINAERVQEFVKNNCSEPIEWVDMIVPFKELVDMLIKSAEEQVEKSEDWIDRIKSKRVLKNIIKWNAKDKNIYELPVYKQLIEQWFILPSDVRTYYDSANRKPVYHLWVDYNVKAGTEVKSMYDWEVVASWLDGWLWHKVIIEHNTPVGTFYSLYGHLGSQNLPKVWDKIEKGMKIWEVWKPFTKENWKWEEHLHFQIMESKDSARWYSETEWEWNYDVLKCFGKQ